MDKDKDADGYYSHLLKRMIRKPTSVLHDMIQEFLKGINNRAATTGSSSASFPFHQRFNSNVSSNAGIDAGTLLDLQVVVNRICERCRTHPDDVNWRTDDNYSHNSMFWSIASIRYFSRCTISRQIVISHMCSILQAMISTDSFRIFDELYHPNMQIFDNLPDEIIRMIVPKIHILKSEHISNNILCINKDISSVISSFLYGRKEQLAVLAKMDIGRALSSGKYHICLFIDGWLSIDPEVMKNPVVFNNHTRLIDYCTRDCCALMVLRNITMTFEQIPTFVLDRDSLLWFIDSCIRNKCIYTSVDAIDLFMKILEVTIERNSENLFDITGVGVSPLLHNIAYSLNYTGHDNIEEWLSFVKEIVNRFPSELLSVQNSSGETPRDIIIDRRHKIKEWYEQALELFTSE